MIEKIIKFINTSIYQGDRLILSKVNFEISSGEFVYLIGRVGSGKTTLIKAIHAELPMAEGMAEVLGCRLEAMTRKEIPYLRRNIGVVFQDFQLLTDRNVHDNLKFVLEVTGWTTRPEINGRIMEVLQKVGLSDKEYEMPNRLSGGEQQRVVIARAILNDPELILADEPTGNIDPESAESIMNIFKDLQSKGKTIVIATHDYNLIKKFEGKVYKFEKGKITFCPDIEEIIDFSSIYG
jgi:cell division transport system ATP-binding protein